MTDTYDVPLEGGGFDFRVRVYPATGAERLSVGLACTAAPSCSARSRCPRPTRWDVGSARWDHRGVGRLHACAPRRADGARPARPGRGHALARADARRGRSRRPARSLPGRHRCRPSRRSTGRSRMPTDWRRSRPDRAGRRERRGEPRDRGDPAAARSRHGGAQPARAGVSVAARRHPAPNDELARLLESVPASRIFTPETRDAINRNYLPDGDDPHGYAFPGGHPVAGLPPVLMVNAELDSLRASGEAFVAELALASVDVASSVSAPRCTATSTRSATRRRSAHWGSSPMPSRLAEPATAGARRQAHRVGCS